MTEPRDHRVWRERIAAAVIERRPLGPDLADHLGTCAACSDEWRRLAGASARLIAASRSLPLDAEPPDRLRGRLMATRRQVAAAGGVEGAPAPEPAAASRPRGRRGWAGRLAWGGARALVGAASVVLVLVVVGSRVGPERVTLAGSSLAPAALGSAVLDRQPNGTVRVTLEIAGLPRSGPHDFYELWLVGDQGRVSAGTFRSDGSPIGLTLATAGDPGAYPRIGITLEPDDGNPAASNDRVAGSS